MHNVSAAWGVLRWEGASFCLWAPSVLDAHTRPWLALVATSSLLHLLITHPTPSMHPLIHAPTRSLTLLPCCPHCRQASVDRGEVAQDCGAHHIHARWPQRCGCLGCWRGCVQLTYSLLHPLVTHSSTPSMHPLIHAPTRSLTLLYCCRQASVDRGEVAQPLLCGAHPIHARWPQRCGCLGCWRGCVQLTYSLLHPLFTHSSTPSMHPLSTHPLTH
jgi:hypothetical protein